MSDISELIRKKDGKSLKAMALEGDAEAAIAFADLVFDAKYAGDTDAVKTKKDAKKFAQEDAFDLIEKAASDGDINAKIKWAETNFHGVREPGNFGSRLRGADYQLAESLYQEILESDDCPSDRRGEFLAHQAQSILFRAGVKKNGREQEGIDLLEKALGESDSQPLVNYILQSIYWDRKEYAKAVECAEACKEDHKFAALTLKKAYEKGLGVEKDLDKSREYYQFWFAGTQPKSRKKA